MRKDGIATVVHGHDRGGFNDARTGRERLVRFCRPAAMLEVAIFDANTSEEKEAKKTGCERENLKRVFLESGEMSHPPSLSNGGFRAFGFQLV